MPIRDYDPRQGFAFQGDIAIIPLTGIAVAAIDEIQPIDGRLIIQEGEVSGHHHAINVDRARNFRPDAVATDPVLTTRDAGLHKAFGGKAAAKTGVRLYRDMRAVEALRGRGVITRTDLAIGCLVVEGGAVVIGHEEHDGIRIPPGSYYLGRQVESAGAEERVVAD